MKRKRGGLRAPRKGGQMLIVVMLMITTVIIMFGMTISVGHLVQSKINLQNAVDLASLSSASYQARHLNAISVANYRIRAVLKYFLFDSYVTMSRFNDKFRTDVLSGGDGLLQDPLLTLAVCQQAYNYDPSLREEGSGRGVDESTNICARYTSTPTIITPLIASPIPGFNPIYIFINLTLQGIADEFAASCKEWSGQNRGWADWAIERGSNDTEYQANHMNKLVRDFQLDMGGRATLRNGTAAMSPSSATTFNTFTSNLIGSIADSVSDAALLYLNGGSDRVLDLSDMQLSTKSYGLAYVEPEWNNGCSILPGGAGTGSGNGKLMAQGFSKLRPEEGGQTLAVGLLGNADVPRILFWPRGVEPAMAAIAAAKPFGSRIGPPAHYFQNEGGGSSGLGNVSMFVGDDASDLSTGGLGHKDLLRAIYQTIDNPRSGRPEDRPVDSLAAMAYSPSIFDSLYYSIFQPNDPFAPIDVLPNPPLDITTRMNDRGGTLPDPGSWGLPSSGRLSKYYRPDAARSAWSTEIGGSDNRAGYQIKLMSIDDLCATSSSGSLGTICSREGTRLL